MNFTCGLPAGDDDPTNAEANQDSPSGTHDPFGGTTYTPGPTPNAGGMAVSGLNGLRPRRKKGEPRISEGIIFCFGIIWVPWDMGWALVGGLIFAFAV